ncbi:MAG: hypothetical protein ABR599_09505 [Gemmatimonadota bacterium]
MRTGHRIGLQLRVLAATCLLVPSACGGDGAGGDAGAAPAGTDSLANTASVAAGEIDSRAARSYLFVWAGDADRRQSDFLAVLDVRPASPRYGRIVATLPVNRRGTMPHHTEHEMPADGPLFANGFMAGRTFRFDLSRPEAPRLEGSFTAAEGYTFPHSYVRMPNGNVLATYQGRGERNVDPGGLVEIDPAGQVVRSGSAADPRAARALIRPYSLTVLPDLDRVVSTSYDMGEDMGLRGGRRGRTRVVQVWRLSDLSVLKTIDLPSGSRGGEGEQPGEPRVLSDGRTVLVSTFTCGLHRITGLADEDPGAELVHAFGGGGCALPIVLGKFWIQSVPSANAIVTLDVSDPSSPKEVSRLDVGGRHFPHWLALDEVGGRIVITDRGDGERRVLMARVDPQTGSLSLDEDFREEGSDRPGISFERDEWPHGASGAATPHGAVFGT